MTISDDVVAQCEHALANVVAALTDAGADISDVVRVRYILPERADFERCWPTLRRHFGSVRKLKKQNCNWLRDLTDWTGLKKQKDKRLVAR